MWRKDVQWMASFQVEAKDQCLVACPGKLIDRQVYLESELRTGALLHAPIALHFHAHQSPFIRLESRALLCPIRQHFAIRRKLGPAVGGGIVGGQALPLRRAARD